MIQRIQSIYLFLAAILMAVSFFAPLIDASTVDLTDYNNSIVTLFARGINTDVLIKPTWGILTFNIFAIILPFISIFLFKNRKKQINLVRISIVCNVLLYITAIAYLYSTLLLFHIEHYHIAIVLPLVAIILEIMAIANIKKDDKLVKSLNRIR